jgi:hypothetical protein
MLLELSDGEMKDPLADVDFSEVTSAPMLLVKESDECLQS